MKSDQLTDFNRPPPPEIFYEMGYSVYNFYNKKFLSSTFASVTWNHENFGDFKEGSGKILYIGEQREQSTCKAKSLSFHYQKRFFLWKNIHQIKIFFIFFHNSKSLFSTRFEHTAFFFRKTIQS